MQWCINTDRENPTEMVRGEGDGCCHFSSSPQPYHTILCAAGSRSVEERGRSISQHTLLKWFLYLALLFLDCLISSICLRQNFCKITSFPFPFLALLLNDMPTRGRPIIGADIKHFTDYRYRPFSKQICR